MICISSTQKRRESSCHVPRSRGVSSNKETKARHLSLPLLLLLLATGALALQDGLTVLVELELGDDNLGGGDGDGDRLAVALLADDCVKT
jgi:hypothetical protein